MPETSAIWEVWTVWQIVKRNAARTKAATLPSRFRETVMVYSVSAEPVVARESQRMQKFSIRR